MGAVGELLSKSGRIRRRRWTLLTRRLKRPRRWPGLQPLPRDEFPVYPVIWHPERTRRTKETDPDGRIIGVEYQFDYEPSRPQFQEEIGPNDVVWIPLYEGKITPPPSVDEPLPEIEKNLRAIEEIGPKCRAVLVGNANSEIRYQGPRPEEYKKALLFIEKHAPLVRSHARPAFAPIFQLLMHDCYEEGGKMRDLLNENDALIISWAGCKWLFEKDYPKFPEADPFPKFQEYLRSMPCWTGVGLQRGLDKGSDRVLKSMGYDAGFMGYF